ncbi:hypothetical protein GF361_04610 [Candidatus Woesearchaeota archaeon]|nr:hypothetical protein [Candidatus Woesearchaeota archaeon]
MSKFNRPGMMPNGSTDKLTEERQKEIIDDIIPALQNAKYKEGENLIDILKSNNTNIRKAEILSEYAGTHIFSGEAAYITEIYKKQSYTVEKMFLEK